MITRKYCFVKLFLFQWYKQMKHEADFRKGILMEFPCCLIFFPYDPLYNYITSEVSLLKP